MKNISLDEDELYLIQEDLIKLDEIFDNLTNEDILSIESKDACPFIQLDKDFDDLIFEETNSATIGDIVDDSYNIEEHEPFLNNQIRQSLMILTPREESVIRQFFGIGCRVYSVEEVANNFCVGAKHIQSVYRSAMSKLKSNKNTLILKQLL